MPTKRRVRHYRIGAPHRIMRVSCKWCRKRRHNHTPSGNTHRFHGPGSFCATHSTTVRGKKYCKTTKTRSRKSDWVYNPRTGNWYYQPGPRKFQMSSKG